MINNFKKILELLSFNDTEFYFIQIYRRKKDNPKISIKHSIIKTYYIDSKIKLEELYPEMIQLARMFNARVGINLNKRSYEQVALYTMENIIKKLLYKDYKSISKTYNSACGKHLFTEDKIWTLDVDNINLEGIKKLNLEASLHSMNPYIKNEIILAYIPSKTGIHVITRPFDSLRFKIKYPEIKIHKNNPTNLFIP